MGPGPNSEQMQPHMRAVNMSLNQMDVIEHGKGNSDRLSADRYHNKSVNLNDSSNVHVEDSLREAIVPQNSKSSLVNSVNYGIGRPSGSSKSQIGRGSRIAGTAKHQSSKLADQHQKTGQS